MNRFHGVLAAALLPLGAALALAAEPVNDNEDPNLTHWQWFAEVRLPAKMDGPYLTLPVPVKVFARSEADLHDLRLVDAANKRVPYVMRVMRPERQPVSVVLRRPSFDAGFTKNNPACYQFKVEVGQVPAPGYNEIEVNTPGTNFRRRLEILGDNNAAFDAAQRVLDGPKYLVKFDDPADGKTAEVRRFRLKNMQFHYLNVRIFADPEAASPKEEQSHIAEASVSVRRTVVKPGESVTEPATLGPREVAPGAASAWMIELPGKMPCHKLILEVAGPRTGVRPVTVQAADVGEPRRDLLNQPRAQTMRVEEKMEQKQNETVQADQAWQWRTEGGRTFLDISFPEVFAGRLRMTITDNANEPFKFKSVQASRWVRHMVFEKPEPEKYTLPLKLYAGCAAAEPPRFDLEQRLPAALNPAPPTAELAGDFQANPSYQPPPLTLNERMPWLVYSVLGTACLVLLLILGSLARQAVGRHDQATKVETFGP